MSTKNPSLLIAYRYFTSKKKGGGKGLQGLFIGQNFIKTLSNISMVGVGVGAAALIVILSVFNGLEELTLSLFSTYNPELQVTPKEGKSFELTDSLLTAVGAIPGVAAINQVIEDDAYMKYGDNNTMVRLKGVGDDFLKQYDLSKGLVSGEMALEKYQTPRALLGIGLYHQLAVQLGDLQKSLLLYYPDRDNRVYNDPDRALNRRGILPSGVLAIEQKFDNKYVIVPISFAEQLFEYEGRRTALEIKTDGKTSPEDVKSALLSQIGQRFEILTAQEQQASVLRAVKIERLFVFITFIVILAIASLNVFFSLAMLAIEKKRDIAVLFSMGATKSLVRRIFITEGVIIAFTGAFFGLLIGFLVVYLQAQFGFVSLGVTSSIVEAYPVKLKVTDFVYTGLVVVAVTMLASYVPASNAARTPIQEFVG